MNFNQINEKLKVLRESKRIEDAHSLVSDLVSLLGIDECKPEELLSHGSVQREISKFVSAQGFRNQASAYTIPHTSDLPFDLKLFWVKKTTKATLSWLVALTPNFEDNPETNSTKNIGLDFVLSEDASSFYIILSNQLKLRVLELSGPLTLTQREILENWSAFTKSLNTESENYKEQLQTHLWKSFDFEPLNRKFYMELVTQFDHVVSHVKKNIDEESAKMFTVRLIGRSLFLWFLKKKEFLNKEKEYFSISGDEDQTTYYREKLEPLFFEVLNTAVTDREYDDIITPFLNGGLFEPIETDFYKDDKLTFPAGFFAQFFEILNRYNFTVDEGTSEYEQVAIDPEMLGRVFENLLASLNDETGKQARKSKGAFYTPREIVDYMCQQSLIEYLKTKLPETQNRDRRIEELVTMDESTFREQDHNKRRDWKKDLGQEQVIKALDDMRVLDPAVGSGAFPMGMLNLLVKVYSRIDTSREKDLASLKRDILSRSLYGVDIDQMAIQISRLRAWLSILVDMENLKKIDPLPNLDFKFVCANTLIPLETKSGLFDMISKDELLAIRDQYYVATRKRDKEKLRKEYLSHIHGSGELFSSKRELQLKDYDPFNPLNSSSFYDPELMHGIEKFDIVIGNPPYGAKSSKENKLLFKKLYKTAFFKQDSYAIFSELAINVTTISGIISYITPYTWITIDQHKKLRDLLFNSGFNQIVDIPRKIFESADLDTIVFLVNKSSSKKTFDLHEFNGEQIEFNKSETIPIDGSPLILNISIEDQALLTKIKKGKPANEYFLFSQGLIPYSKPDLIKKYGKTKGESIIKNREWHSNTFVPDWGKELQGKDIDNYTLHWSGKFINYGSHLHAPRERKFFIQPRVIVREIVRTGIKAAYTEEEFYNSPVGINIISKSDTTEDLKLLCLVLNSKLANFYYKMTGVKFNATTSIPKILVGELKKFPFKKSADISTKTRLLNEFENVLKFKSSNFDTTNIKQEIDELVMMMYDLTEKEKEIIRNS